MILKKTLLLACSFEGPWLERFLTKQGYDVVRSNSGVETLDTISVKQPDVLLIYGGILEDTHAYELIIKIRRNFPNHSMRAIFMTNERFEDVASIEWDFGGFDVVLPRDTPQELLLPILEKMKE